MKGSLLLFIFLPLTQIFGQGFCTLNIGADTTLCFPDTLILNAGPGFSSYTWNTGATTQSINVTQPGNYAVSVYALGNEAVSNGNFSQGNTGFTSGYIYAVNLWPESTYWVGSNANLVHPNFIGVAHSSPNFMVVNGSSNPTLNVWCQTINNIMPNTTYLFSAWVCTVAPSSPAILQFRVNNVPLSAAFTAPATTGIWSQYSATWFSGNNTTASICIQNQNLAPSGNDFGLDDISFIPVCQKSDTIAIGGTQQAQISFSNPDSICVQQAFTLQASPAGGIWYGSNVADSINGIFNFSTPGIFLYRYEIPGSCGDVDTGFIYVAEYPDPDLGEDFQLCPGDQAQLGPVGMAGRTLWNTGALTSSITISDTGTYWVLQENYPGCISADTIQVFWRCPMDPVLSFPNVFTPNSDGINDLFEWKYEYIGRFHLQIYNRWGVLVFETLDVNDFWDGKGPGEKNVADGVYFFTAIYEGSEVKGEKEITGSITVTN